MELENNGGKGANGHSNGNGANTSNDGVSTNGADHIANGTAHEPVRDRFSWVTDRDINDAPDLSRYRINGEGLEQELKSFSFPYDTGVTIHPLKDERRIEIVFNITTADTSRAHDEQKISQKSLKLAHSLIRSIQRPMRKPMLRLWQAIRSQKPPIQFEGPYMPSGRGTLVLGIDLSRDANYDGCYNIVHRILATHRLNEDKITKATFEARQDPNRQRISSSEQYAARRTSLEELALPPELVGLKDKHGNKVYDKEGHLQKPEPPKDTREAAANILREMARRI